MGAAQPDFSYIQMEISEMTRAAIYVRVSTDMQAEEGFSLDSQLERLRAYSKAQGWTVAREYIERGGSGRTIKRVQYARMMEDQDRWDTILVLKIDRIHRSSRNFLDMIAQLRTDGKQFASVMENLDTSTAMGRFVMSIMSNVAQLESEQISERTTAGMVQKAKQKGGGLGGSAPYGYKWEHGQLVIVPEEAVIVRRIFAMKIEGPGTIASILNSEGLKTRKAKPWTFWNVQRILKNKRYTGNLTWMNLVQKDAHEAIF